MGFLSTGHHYYKSADHIINASSLTPVYLPYSRNLPILLQCLQFFCFLGTLLPATLLRCNAFSSPVARYCGAETYCDNFGWPAPLPISIHCLGGWHDGRQCCAWFAGCGYGSKWKFLPMHCWGGVVHLGPGLPPSCHSLHHPRGRHGQSCTASTRLRYQMKKK